MFSAYSENNSAANLASNVNLAQRMKPIKNHFQAQIIASISATHAIQTSTNQIFMLTEI